MSDELHNALNIAKGIQAAADAAGMGKTYDYTIGGVTFSTNRPLPDAVQKYIDDWADDPVWDIWDVADPAFGEYEPELRVYAAVYETVKTAAWEQRIADVTDLRAARLDLLKGDHEAARTRAAIAQAEAARPRWVRIGAHRFNVALIAQYWFGGLDANSYPKRDTLTVTHPAASRDAWVETTFYDKDAIAGAKLLDSLLMPILAE